MTAELAVSVVIPTRNRREELRQTLLSLFSQTLPPEQYEIVVVIDGSNDGTLEMLADLQRSCALKWVSQPHRGRAVAINAGVKQARGEVLVFLDDDIAATESLLQAHHAYLRAHPGRAVVGAAPIILSTDAPPVARHVGQKMNAHLMRIGRPGFEFGPRDFYSGNFAIERSVFLGLGGFDEDFVLYGYEDCELARRLSLKGIPIVYNHTAVGHQRYVKTFRDLARDTYQKGRNAVLFSRKHPEVTSSLKLAEETKFSWKLRLLMTLALLRVPGPSRSLAVLLRLIGWVDERWPAVLVPRYAAMLDFFFWLGANEELRTPADAWKGSSVY